LCVRRQRRSRERLTGADLTGSAWPPLPDRGTATLGDMSEVTYRGADGIGRQAAGLPACEVETPPFSASARLEVWQRRLRAYDQAAREEE